MHKTIAKCISACIVMSCLGTGIVMADDTNADDGKIHFPQKVVYDASNIETGFATDDVTYTYSLSPVTDADILARDAGSGGTVYAGIDGGLVLNTTTLTIEGFEIDPKASENVASKDVIFEVNEASFDVVGIYRYLFEAESNDYDQKAYIDVYIAEGQKPILNFYDFDKFDSEIDKLSGFTDNIKITAVEGKTEQRSVVFRFVDEEGIFVAEDIQVTKDFVISEGSYEYTRKKADVPVKAAAKKVDTIEVALSSYEATLEALLKDNYTVVSDEVAAHKETEEPWFTENQVTIYKVVLKKAEVTPTPKPTATPTPVPGKTTYQTGITRYASLYVAGAVALLIIAGGVSAVIIIKNKRSEKGN